MFSDTKSTLNNCSWHIFSSSAPDTWWKILVIFSVLLYEEHIYGWLLWQTLSPYWVLRWVNLVVVIKTSTNELIYGVYRLGVPEKTLCMINDHEHEPGMSPYTSINRSSEGSLSNNYKSCLWLMSTSRTHSTAQTLKKITYFIYE